MVEFSRKPIEGVAPLTPLCLHDNQEINYNGIKSNIQLLEDWGMQGFIQFGGMGQYFGCSENEFNKVCDICVETANDITCIVGSTATNSREAIRRAKYAEDAGADGTMLAIPYVKMNNAETAAEFFRDVDKELDGDLAIMVYNYPPSHKFNISTEVWTNDLLKLESVKAAKASNYEFPHHQKLMTTICDDVNVFPGEDVNFWMTSQYGANGILGILTWVAPNTMLRWYQECMDGNHHSEWTFNTYKTLLDVWYDTKKIRAKKKGYYGIAALHSLVELGGGIAGPPRKPYTRLPPNLEEEFSEAVQPLIELEKAQL